MPVVLDAPPASEWPFRLPLCPPLPAESVQVRMRAVDDACVNRQSGTQLVTTQRAYLDAEWAAALAAHGRASIFVEPGDS
ncbi:MAG: hypothetical protein ACKOEC_00635, partial [Acidimicrobiia bacterium]